MNQLPEGTVSLTLYGNLETFPEYAAELGSMAQHPGIRFMGQVARDELWPAMAHFDVLVLPTLWYEASPLIIQEAFAVDLPIVASDIGAMPELIADDVDGLLVPPGDVDALRDALLRLLEDPDLLQQLRQGIHPVRSIDDHLQEVGALYRRS